MREYTYFKVLKNILLLSFLVKLRLKRIKFTLSNSLSHLFHQV